MYRQTLKRVILFLILLFLMIQFYFVHTIVSDSFVVNKENNQVMENPDTWCSRLNTARSGLAKHLHITYPCERLPPTATSAVVCMLTDGVEQSKDASRIVFTFLNYMEGAMALGSSVRKHIDLSNTHMLLLIREGLELDPKDRVRLEASGWTVGTAPNIQVSPKYTPRFPRYKTTYTKITAIGMQEYKCVLLLDADTLVIGDIQELLTCNKFTLSQQHVAGTLDYYRGQWKYFNTGSVLWKTNNKEMERVYQLSQNENFMQRFSSDQAFLNHVYPERTSDVKLNKQIIDGRNLTVADSGSVVTLPWDYNAQTHVEVQKPIFWNQHRNTVKILHFTEKKGWQCKERYKEVALNEIPVPCDKSIDICYCQNAHLYWMELTSIKAFANRAVNAYNSGSQFKY